MDVWVPNGIGKPRHHLVIVNPARLWIFLDSARCALSRLGSFRRGVRHLSAILLLFNFDNRQCVLVFTVWFLHLKIIQISVFSFHSKSTQFSQ